MKGISIIITCYNCEKYIEECIESIINLKINNLYEIIVVDDSSTDNSAKILKKYQEYKNITIHFNESNMGVQKSRNTGIALAKYNYIMVIDGDDKLNDLRCKNNKTYIDEAIYALENDANVAFVQGIWEMFGDNVRLYDNDISINRKFNC